MGNLRQRFNDQRVSFAGYIRRWHSGDYMLLYRSASNKLFTKILRSTSAG